MCAQIFHIYVGLKSSIPILIVQGGGGGRELSPSSLLLANIHDQIINYGNQTGSFANGTEKKN